VTLHELSARQPLLLDDFATVKGVGTYKLEKYGKLFIEEIHSFVKSTQQKTATHLPPSIDRTVAMYQDGVSVDEIAKKRLIARSTVIDHLATAAELDGLLDLSPLIEQERAQRICAAFSQLGMEKLAPNF
jgi:ATP-dependent DNA helicase RecQ